jgi:HD-GYP domain-containing protein (c-di-GMP phosphodiesterase class II)
MLRKTAGPPKDVPKAYPAFCVLGNRKEARRMKQARHSFTELAVAVARKMCLSDEQIRHLRRGAILHDIGEIGVSDAVMQKSGKFTQEERAHMMMYPLIAKQMIQSFDYLKPAADIPYCHHERWDGTGYPRGLKGKQIPIAARIFAVVDVALPDRMAVDYIAKQSGKHFDPEVVKAFLEVLRSKMKSGSEPARKNAKHQNARGHNKRR